MSDYDARDVALYDEDNPDGPDHDFYRSLADDLGATRILDLGCGTGILTVTFTKPDREVVGVDPSRTMLNYARARPGGDAVTWVLGDSSAIPPRRFDLAVMTGNVAQHIPESSWTATLRDLRQALRPGGLLAFETRNPVARAWEKWSGVGEPREVGHGPIQERMDVREIVPGTVELTEETHYLATGERTRHTQLLEFRSSEHVAAALESCGFAVESVFADWSRTPFLGPESLMVFIARAR